MKKSYFYILSYPRCRSTWFTQFFCTNVSYCFHELLSSNDTAAFYKTMHQWPRNYVGSADTNPISFGRTERVIGPMVIVLRKEKDVIRSLLKAFDRHEAFTKKEWEQYIHNTVSMFSICLEWYKDHEPGVKVVDFEALEDEKVLRDIFVHCVPTHDPEPAYIEKMNGLKITVKRRQGMSNGIEASRRNRKLSIKEFKRNHLERYDPEKFKRDWYREPPSTKKYTGPLYLGAATLGQLAIQ